MSIASSGQPTDYNGYISKTSYSGADIRVFVLLDPTTLFDSNRSGIIGNGYRELGELQTISYSVYREKEMVKALGNPMPKGYTRGYVTIAGTMVFTVMYKAVLHELFENSFFDAANYSLSNIRVDQLPPLDVFITFTNETGQISKLGIFGIEFMNEGQVMSAADLMTENSVNYVARHISPLTQVSDAGFGAFETQQIEEIYMPRMFEVDYENAAKDIERLRNFFYKG